MSSVNTSTVSHRYEEYDGIARITKEQLKKSNPAPGVRVRALQMGSPLLGDIWL